MSKDIYALPQKILVFLESSNFVLFIRKFAIPEDSLECIFVKRKRPRMGDRDNTLCYFKGLYRPAVS